MLLGVKCTYEGDRIPPLEHNGQPLEQEHDFFSVLSNCSDVSCRSPRLIQWSIDHMCLLSRLQQERFARQTALCYLSVLLAGLRRKNLLCGRWTSTKWVLVSHILVDNICCYYAYTGTLTNNIIIGFIDCAVSFAVFCHSLPAGLQVASLTVSRFTKSLEDSLVFSPGPPHLRSHFIAAV